MARAKDGRSPLSTDRPRSRRINHGSHRRLALLGFPRLLPLICAWLPISHEVTASDTPVSVQSPGQSKQSGGACMEELRANKAKRVFKALNQISTQERRRGHSRFAETSRCIAVLENARSGTDVSRSSTDDCIIRRNICLGKSVLPMWRREEIQSGILRRWSSGGLRLWIY